MSLIRSLLAERRAWYARHPPDAFDRSMTRVSFIGLALYCLKLAQVIDWPWWVVLVPLYPLGFFAGVIVWITVQDCVTRLSQILVCRFRGHDPTWMYADGTQNRRDYCGRCCKTL